MKVKSLVKTLWHSPYPLSQRRTAVPDAGHGGKTGRQKVLLLFSIMEQYIRVYLGSCS